MLIQIGCGSCYLVFSKQQSVIQQLQARKGRLIVICSKGDARLMCPNGGCRVIEVPQLQDCLQPIINIVPFQVHVLPAGFSCQEDIFIMCKHAAPGYATRALMLMR